jgi:hypothetical protein
VDWISFSLLIGAALCSLLAEYLDATPVVVDEARLARLRAKREWDAE